jgi:hypothetical protein
MNSTKAFCRNCGKELKLDQRPCPFCGCRSIHLEATGFALLGLLCRANYRFRKIGEHSKRFVKEIIRGQFLSENPELPKGVYKERIIDRGRNEYHEVIEDVKTGRTVRDVHEPLSQHRHRQSPNPNHHLWYCEDIMPDLGRD